MPLLVRVQVGRPDRRTLRFWIPVLPVLLLLSPLLVLAALAAAVTCLVWRIPPIRALVAAGRLVCALRGTRIEIDQPDARLLIDVR